MDYSFNYLKELFENYGYNFQYEIISKRNQCWATQTHLDYLNIIVEIKDKFIDGASVAQMGTLNFELCYKKLFDVKAVEEGLVCKTMLELYNENAMVVEPAGALSLSVLEYYKQEIKGKNVVCLISGGNNDIMRMEEIKERALLFQGLKHYLVLRFPQRPGALKEFVSEVLGPDDDIVHFEYTRKHNRENGPALVGVELKSDTDWDALKSRLKEKNYKFEYLNEKEDLFQFIT